ncbi:hypothetical protein CICLE_v10013656mg [Citrus x clementina]|uniref:Uncharacterized protein n=1 Tax=Citrus clementina TaxID=85681 RepID=V4UQY5_CITCL|nr:hypothetical protein CICLE_v10013656mg [Citrus x clementina]
MGDLLGSPRVAPLFLSFQSVNHLFAADPFNFWRQIGWSSSGGAWGHFLTFNFEFFLYFDTFLRLQFF